MERKLSIILMWLIVIVTILSTIYFYDALPDIMPTHWNASGEVDGYSSKEIGAFLLPIMAIFVALIFVIIPYIEPNKKNLKKFALQYNTLGLLLVAFFAYLHYLVIFASIVEQINMMRLISPALGIIFFYVGILLNKAKQNYTVGIRTPWTLANEKVWEQTHKKGGILFKISGTIALFGLVFAEYAFILVIVPILISSIFLFIYSYYLFKKTKK